MLNDFIKTVVIMKIILIFAACVALTVADIGISSSTFGGYQSSVSTPHGSYLPPKSYQRETVISDNYVPKTKTHVYVYSANDDHTEQEKRIIRVNGGDKNVNIIFIKPPSESSQSETEILLPKPEEQRNIVYVLVKKSSAENNIKITKPQPSTPAKPEVHFVKFTPVVQTPKGLYAAPVATPAPSQQPSGLYGTPSAAILSPPTQTVQAQPIRRVYGTPADIPPPSPVREPSGLYETPEQ